MNKKLLWLLTVLFLVTSTLADAQQAKKIPRVGYLTANTSSAELPRLDAFRQGLHDLGHIDGQNIVIEYRHAEGKFERK